MFTFRDEPPRSRSLIDAILLLRDELETFAMTERVDHVVASKSCVAVFSLKPVMLPDVVLIFVFFIGSSLFKNTRYQRRQRRKRPPEVS